MSKLCRVTFTILHPVNKDPVRVIECEALVFKRPKQELERYQGRANVLAFQKPALNEDYYYLPFNKGHIRVHPQEDRVSFTAKLRQDRFEELFPLAPSLYDKDTQRHG